MSSSIKLSLAYCFATIQAKGESVSFRIYNSGNCKMIKFYGDDVEYVRYAPYDEHLPIIYENSKAILFPIG